MVDGQIEWWLEASFQSRKAFPVFGDAVAVEYGKESGQEFFRPKFSGTLTFIGKDYEDIMGEAFDRRFLIQGFVWQNGSYTTFLQGHFYKADCEVDVDAKSVKVTPIVDDNYEEIIAGLEKEYNLVKLAPEVVRLQANKRPLIQVYRSNSSQLTNILSGMCWTQDCDPLLWNEVQSGGYQFTRISRYIREFSFSGEGSWKGVIPEVFYTKTISPSDPVGDLTKDGYTLRFRAISGTWYEIRILDSDENLLWYGSKEGMYGEYTMSPRGDETGNLTIYYANPYAIYCRILCDVDEISGTPTSPIPSPDICENSLNYSRVIGYSPGENPYIWDDLSSQPTEWGVTENGTYFVKPEFPASAGFGDILPICPDSWAGVSAWWIGTPTDWLAEQSGRKAFMLNDTFPLWSVINVLLSANNTGLTFGDSADYSRFLYGDGGGIRGANYRLFMTPKSNIISAEYDQAAQRGNISLRQVFDMLRDCFRCYWFVDGNKLRIEHIEFFRRGGSYDSTPAVGVNLVTQYYSRSGKAVATGQSKYKYNKPETYSRIEFGWMDDVTAQFNGYPIDIISAYVEQGRVEKKDINQFTSDIDYVLLNPSAVSKDGFMLLCAVDDSGTWKIPFVNFGDNERYVLQNGYMSFLWLVQYYLYDLPAQDYEINGEAGTALGTIPLKTQEVTFPAEWMPDLLKLVRTYLGDGKIEKMSIELVSLNCKATLNYASD